MVSTNTVTLTGLVETGTIVVVKVVVVVFAVDPEGEALDVVVAWDVVESVLIVDAFVRGSVVPLDVVVALEGSEVAVLIVDAIVRSSVVPLDVVVALEGLEVAVLIVNAFVRGSVALTVVVGVVVVAEVVESVTPTAAGSVHVVTVAVLQS